MIKLKIQNSKVLRFLPLKGAWGVFLLLLFFACSRGHYTHKAARKAAEKYYTMLIKGNYKGFVNGYASAEDLPDDFRSQLIDATAQFMAKDDMRRLKSVQAISDSLLEDSTAYVMLQLNFSDSTSEQIELALVLLKEGWRMR
ncbi:MAG: hypothetical protein J6W03_03615 [Bacteroidaceae bacterium]|nr:hypothetical protein [Bacteroidaceae bacterium]